jgi:hypothetical protein
MKETMTDVSDNDPLITVRTDDNGVVWYGYPHTYFDPETGKGPGTTKEAEAWWPFRHKRTNLKGIIEQPADNHGQLMKDEKICKFMLNKN